MRDILAMWNAPSLSGAVAPDMVLPRCQTELNGVLMLNLIV